MLQKRYGLPFITVRCKVTVSSRQTENYSILYARFERMLTAVRPLRMQH